MLRRLLFLVCLSLFTVAFSQNASTVDFEIRNLGINVDGHFNKFTISTKFNADNVLESLRGEIQVNSIFTGIDSRDEHLLEEDYFDVTKYPTMTLKSRNIKKQTNTNYVIKADLKIKDKTKQISFPVIVKRSEKSLQLLANFEINRKDFGVGGSSFVMSKTVKISVIHTKKIDE